MVPRALNFGEFSQGKAQQPMPQALAAYEADINDFADKCCELCKQLLRLFALGLKVFSKFSISIDADAVLTLVRSILRKVARNGSPSVMIVRRAHQAASCGFYVYYMECTPSIP